MRSWINPEGATAEQNTDTDQGICPLPTVKGTSYSFYSEKSSEGVLPGQRLQHSFRPGIEQLRRPNASLHGALPLQPISVLWIGRFTRTKSYIAQVQQQHAACRAPASRARKSGAMEKMPWKALPVIKRLVGPSSLIFIFQDWWKEIVYYLGKHERPWDQILYCHWSAAVSAQSLGPFQIHNRQLELRSELSTWYCASQISKGSKNEKATRQRWTSRLHRLWSGCSKTWDSTFLRKQGLSFELRGHPTRH